MSELSPWAPPTETHNTTPQQALEARYPDRNDPDNIDNMVRLLGDEKPAMIEVPDWSAPSPEAREVAIEQPRAQKMGETVLDAAGVAEVVDDSIDENAQYLTAAQLREMRETRAQMNTEPPLTQSSLESMMSAPVDILQELTKGLSEGDVSNLRRYAQASEEVRLAQKEGRGEDSTYHQQTKGQAYRDMSPSAQAAAIRFDGHYNMPA